MSKKCSSLILLALLAGVVAGCSQSSPQDQLIGQWEGEIELDEAVINQKLDAALPEDKGRLTQQFQQMREMQMTVDFEQDGEMKMSATIGPIQNAVEGTWELTKHEGSALTVKMIEPNRTDENTLVFRDKDTFEMEPPGGDTRIGVMRFRRIR